MDVVSLSIWGQLAIATIFFYMAWALGSKPPIFEIQTVEEPLPLAGRQRSEVGERRDRLEMVGSANKLRSAFSWADEVEKEEEAAAARTTETRFSEKRKPNPFGSGRPREVVLQERGIDWRKLDHDLPQSSPQFSSKLPKEKEKSRKEKIPTASTPLAVRGKQPPIPLSRGPQGIYLPQERPLVPLDQVPGAFVPPLRYPPKNVASLVDEARNFHRPQRMEIQRRGFQHNHHEESTFDELELKQFHKFGSSRPSRSQSHQHIGHFSIEEGSKRIFNEEDFANRAGRNADFSHGKRRKFCKRSLAGSRRVDERREDFVIHDYQFLPSAEERNWKNTQDGHEDDVLRRHSMGQLSTKSVKNRGRRLNH
ncbi:uncharacterized protein LOC131156102 [Malania oleifera]|uniref:uncharacterized protein LOC131156102 n=1 Tax=Malania oleifera TaxID=397392 RepID=UPI0025ADE15B|nr:uncharacterized protein LOC131156102 [Malania oleifera]